MLLSIMSHEKRNLFIIKRILNLRKYNTFCNVFSETELWKFSMKASILQNNGPCESLHESFMCVGFTGGHSTKVSILTEKNLLNSKQLF